MLALHNILRLASSSDRLAIRDLLLEVASEGESLPFLDVPLSMIDDHWLSATGCYLVTGSKGELNAMYRMGANMVGRGSHIATATFVVAMAARRRGLGRLMLDHCINQARAAGYTAIQFNYVVETNRAALQLYQNMNFDIVGRLPGAFRHARLGEVDVLILFHDLR